VSIYMIIIPVGHIPRYIWGSLLVLLVIFIYLIVKFTQRNNLDIIKEKYKKKYSLEIKNKWDYKIIQKIHYLKLSEFFIENNIKPSKSDISSMIEYLKYEIKVNSYIYKFPEIISTLFGALIGTFLGAIFSQSTKEQPTELFPLIKKFSLLFTLIFMMIIFTEHFIIKDFINRKQNRHIRLIRALENYRFNLCKT